MNHSLMSYIREYRCVSLHQKPFNQVDALLLSQLAYLKMKEVVPGFGAAAYPTLRQMHDAEKYEEMFSDPVYGSMYRDIFELIWNSRRYSQIKAVCYTTVHDTARECRFAAVSFLLGESSTFVAFRGTDETLLSWKEDLKLSCMDVIPSQERALCYLTEMAHHTHGRMIIGGHSKGGNLAVYAAAMASDRIQHRISRIYNFDGVGFQPDFYQGKGYRQIQDRIFKLVPRQSTIGQILCDQPGRRIVKSYKKGFQQHDLMNWQIRNGKFQYTKTLHLSSRRFGKRVNSLLSSLSEQERMEVVNKIYDILGGDQVRTVYELKISAIVTQLLHYLAGPKDPSKRALVQTIGILASV